MERSEYADTQARAGATKKRKVKGIATTSLVLAILVVFAPAAWGHTAAATISCKKVTYHFAQFPDTTGNTVHENVYVNGIPERAATFTFDGSTAKNTVMIAVAGSASVEARAEWNTNGAKGSYQVTQEVSGCIIQ